MIVSWHLHGTLDQTLFPMNGALLNVISLVSTFCISSSHRLTAVLKSCGPVSQIVRRCSQRISFERRRQKDKMQPHTYGLYIVHSGFMLFHARLKRRVTLYSQCSPSSLQTRS